MADHFLRQHGVSHWKICVFLSGVLSLVFERALGGHRSNSTKLCHMSGREPDMKIVVENLGPLPYNVGPQKLPISACFNDDVAT